MPKPGAWMVWVRQFLGFPMLASVIWLLWVLLQQWGAESLVPLLGLMLCVALGVWIVGVCQHKGRFRLAFGLLIGMGVLCGGAYLGMSPRAGVSAVAAPSAFLPFSESTLQAARDSGRPVFVDVTAAWCLTCQVNKKTVLETAQACLPNMACCCSVRTGPHRIRVLPNIWPLLGVVGYRCMCIMRREKRAWCCQSCCEWGCWKPSWGRPLRASKTRGPMGCGASPKRCLTVYMCAHTMCRRGFL